MKTIGILGGMSWESTREYYRLINEGIREKLGGLHSAEILLASVDFAPISDAMENGDWSSIETTLAEYAQHLTIAGADLILIATNTMHKLAAKIAEAAEPATLIHIGDCAAAEARRFGYTKVALLGTRFTMEEDFYTGRLKNAGIDVVVPQEKQRKRINEIIFSELCAGIFQQDSRKYLSDIVKESARAGAEAVVLGCTELPLILTAKESVLPILDTMAIHAEAAVRAALL